MVFAAGFSGPVLKNVHVLNIIIEANTNARNTALTRRNSFDRRTWSKTTLPIAKLPAAITRLKNLQGYCNNAKIGTESQIGFEMVSVRNPEIMVITIMMRRETDRLTNNTTTTLIRKATIHGH